MMLNVCMHKLMCICSHCRFILGQVYPCSCVCITGVKVFTHETKSLCCDLSLETRQPVLSHLPEEMANQTEEAKASVTQCIPSLSERLFVFLSIKIPLTCSLLN